MQDFDFDSISIQQLKMLQYEIDLELKKRDIIKIRQKLVEVRKDKSVTLIQKAKLDDLDKRIDYEFKVTHNRYVIDSLIEELYILLNIE